jgi:hypothetical protein
MTLTTYLDKIAIRIMSITPTATWCSVAQKLNHDAVNSDMDEVDPTRFEVELQFHNAGFHVKAQAYRYFEYFYELSDGDDSFLEDVVLTPIEEMSK